MSETAAQDSPSPPAGSTVADRLRGARGRWFVGRAAELELFRCALEAEEPPFSVLFVHGPGGVGKTALLQAFWRRWRRTRGCEPVRARPAGRRAVAAGVLGGAGGGARPEAGGVGPAGAAGAAPCGAAAGHVRAAGGAGGLAARAVRARVAGRGDRRRGRADGPGRGMAARSWLARAAARGLAAQPVAGGGARAAEAPGCAGGAARAIGGS